MKLHPSEQRNAHLTMKRLAPLEQNATHEKILHWFFSYPERKIGLNELSSTLNISKTTARKVVLILIEQGILNKEVFGNIWQLSFNPLHKDAVTLKVPYNLRMIYASRIVDILREKYPSARAIILFGSYRKGDDNDKSDIDIAIEFAGRGIFEIKEFGRIPGFGYRDSIAINTHLFSRDKIDPNLFANIANGIVLEGFLEVSP